VTKLAAACALACLPFAAAAQTLYKCVLQGKTVYQDAPCPETAKQDLLQAPPPGPAKAATVKDAAGKDVPAPKEPPPSDLDVAIDVMAGYRACADAIFEWEGAHRTAYEMWRMQNGAVISRIESDPEAQRKYSQKLQALQGGNVGTCTRVLAVIKPGDTNFMKDVRKDLGAPRKNP
jgi:hypothetical protein